MHEHDIAHNFLLSQSPGRFFGMSVHKFGVPVPSVRVLELKKLSNTLQLDTFN